eukprot:CAMPEP_0174301330 /NCGR_PEP_ID=MMETSP0809-20121228/58988_1 /TAXON_ID=73025 ORGANISM="Eutreptiella gymnastica-like, Strain CCMP1594" /NCGR_SAMPLE_ID=MMETSP0809 /ASSEMBLY_ACC=CAM_ASM_000658 /LENGTH=422 /DNA_ID=CAMNT_0015407069 /DNA_START=23 /DNA_END=1291 /DNA_ORIENTATION=+
MMMINAHAQSVAPVFMVEQPAPQLVQLVSPVEVQPVQQVVMLPIPAPSEHTPSTHGGHRPQALQSFNLSFEQSIGGGSTPSSHPLHAASAGWSPTSGGHRPLITSFEEAAPVRRPSSHHGRRSSSAKPGKPPKAERPSSKPPQPSSSGAPLTSGRPRSLPCNSPRDHRSPSSMSPKSPSPSSSPPSPSPFVRTPSPTPPPAPQEARFEKATRYDYVFELNKWNSSPMNVRIQKQPFQKGSLRYAYHMVDDAGNKYVAKIRRKPPTSNKAYFEDAAMQATCAHFALAYNRRCPPKLVSFIDAFVIQLTERETRTFMACEEYLPGEYSKYNNNGGWKNDDDRNTPQSFSHFTYVHSKGKLIVVDIQGVGDRYTDPQLHSLKQQYGPADLGHRGMQLFFKTHTCNSICKGIGLTDKQVDFTGTQM